MISLESIIECLLKGEAKLSMFISAEEFEKYTKEIAEEVVSETEEEAKEFEERERDLFKSYSGGDNPLQSICFFMIRRKITKLTKKEFVKLYHQFMFIHEQFTKSFGKIIEKIEERCEGEEKEGEMYY
jgi:hypothetical protein